MNLFSAQGAYGYSGNSLLSPGGTAMTPEQPGVANQTSPFGKLPITWNNPLFWLLLLFLVWSGYIFFGFNFGIKKVFKESLKVG
jgi:hypothetical protein